MNIVKFIKSAVISSIAFSGLSYADIYLCNQSDVSSINVAFAYPVLSNQKASAYSNGWYKTGPKGSCNKISTSSSKDLFWIGVFGFATVKDDNNENKAMVWSGDRNNFNGVSKLCISTNSGFNYKHDLKNGRVVRNKCPQGAYGVPFGLTSLPNKDIYFYFTNESISSSGLRKKITVRK